MGRRSRPVAPTSTVAPSTPTPPGRAVLKELPKPTPTPPGRAVLKELPKPTPTPPGRAVPKELPKPTPEELARDRRQAGPDRDSVRCSSGRAGPARNRLGSGRPQAPWQGALSARSGRRRVA